MNTKTTQTGVEETLEGKVSGCCNAPVVKHVEKNQCEFNWWWICKKCKHAFINDSPKSCKYYSKFGVGNCPVHYPKRFAVFVEKGDFDDWLSKVISQAKEEGAQKEICICAAVKADDGSIYRGNRHGDCMLSIRQRGKKLMNDIDAQGFITSTGRYVTRKEGRKLQDAAGIPSADKDGYRGDTLFSEDLY